MYQVSESSQTDKSKYCHFHKSHDHNTNDFIQLKDVIEGMTREAEKTH